MSGEGVIPAPSPTAADPPPMLTFGEAEALGVGLHDRFELMLGPGKAPLRRDDFAWGDLVQFVLRRASEAVRDRPGKGDC